MNKLTISLMVSILLLIGGCGTPMKKVMQQCDRGQAFDSFAYCVKRTYANEGTKPNDSAVRTFYANLDMITETYNNKRITEAEAKSLAWDSYMKTIQASIDQADTKEERETIERITRQCEALGVKRETEKFLTCAIEMRKIEALSNKKPTFAEALGEGMMNNATRKPAFTQCFPNGPYTNCITR
jgi:hypothetical protein